MAGSVIKGITVVINGDTTKLSKALKQLDAQTKAWKSNLRDVNRLLKIDPTNYDAIARKQSLLTSSISAYQKKIEGLMQAEKIMYANRSNWNEKDQKDYDDLRRKLDAAELGLEEMTDEAKKFGTAASTGALAAKAEFSALGDTLLDAGKKLMVLSAGTALIGGYAIYAAAKYESAFAGVRKTVDATESEFQDLSDTIRETALEKPIDATDIAYAAELGGQLGIAVENLGQFSSVIADLDVATNLDLEDASMKLAQFANIAGIGEENFDRLGSVIVDLGNNSATTESKIMNMSMRIAGSGSNIGLSAQEILALATSLASVGIEAEMGGNAISTIMNRIDKDVALGTDTLQVWADTAGMSAEEFKAAWDDSDTVMDAFMAVVDGMATYRDEGGNLNTLLQDMEISYMRQVDTMQRLSRTGEIVNEMVGIANNAWDENIALTREANRRYETTENQLMLVKNNFKEIAIQLGEIMTPTLREFSGDLVDALKDFQNLDDGTKQTIVKFLAFATAAGPVTLALAGVAKGMSWLIGLYASGITNLALLTRGTATFVGAADAAAAATARAAAKTKLMNAALSVSGTLLTTVVAVGIGLMIKGLMDAAERERDFTTATEGLHDALTYADESLIDLSGTLDGISTVKAQKSYQQLKGAIDEAIESQARLAENTKESMGEVNGNAEALGYYMETIKALTNKYDENGNAANLNAGEQDALYAAVAGVNEILGTNYSVINATKGILSESTEEILRNADAWILNAKAQAMQEAYVEYYKQHLTNQRNLADAEATRDAAYAYWDANPADPTATRQAADADARVEEARALAEASAKDVAWITEEMGKLNSAIQGTKDAIADFIEGSPAWQEALSESGIDVDELAGKLEELGLTTADLSAITPEQLATLVGSFGLSAEEIAAVFEQLGITVPEKLAQAVANSSTAIEENSPVVTDAAAKVKKRVVNEFDMKGDLYSAGKNGIQGLSSAFSEDSAEKSGLLSAVSGLARSVLNTFYSVVGQGSPWKTMIESGKFGVEGLGVGFSKYGYIAEDEAESLGTRTVTAMQRSFDGKTFSLLGSTEGYGAAVRLITGAPSAPASGGSVTENNYYIDGINVNGTTDGQFAAEFMALMKRYGRLAKT